MIEEMSIDELKFQLDANDIDYDPDYDKDMLVELLSEAIEEGDAELKPMEETETQELTVEPVVSKQVKPKKVQASLLDCINQNKKMQFTIDDKK